MHHRFHDSAAVIVGNHSWVRRAHREPGGHLLEHAVRVAAAVGVAIALFVGAVSARAERTLVPMRPIDRPYPAIDWCQMQDPLYFFAPGCTVFVDLAVKLTSSTGTSYGVIGIDDILVQRYGDLRSNPVCTRCPNVTDANGNPLYHNWCYSSGGTPVLDEDFAGDWFADGWRTGPGASVAFVNGSRCLRFAASTAVSAAPCDTARARLILTGLTAGAQYVVTGWWSVESPYPGHPPFFWGVSAPSACGSSMPTDVSSTRRSAPIASEFPAVWPDLPVACRACTISVTNAYSGSVLVSVGANSSTIPAGQTQRFQVPSPTSLCVWNCVWTGSDWACSWPCLQQACPGAGYTIQRDGPPEQLTIVRSTNAPALSGVCWATPFQCGAQVDVERRESAATLLLQPAANPARVGAPIRFQFALPVQGPVRLRVLDVAGATVATVLDADLSPGPRQATWDTRGADGRVVRPGVYFAVLEAARQRRSTSVVLLR